MEILNVTCIRATNSVDFVKQVFSCYQSKRVFAISAHPDAATFEAQTGLASEKFIQPSNEGGWLRGHGEFPADDSPAQVVFTSGTEGKPKAIVLTYRNLHDVVTRINEAMEVTADIREYIGVPVYHSFGLGRCRAVTAAGGQAFLPKGGFNLIELQAMLADGKVNAISAVPSLWRTVLENAERFTSVAAQVRWIEIGSQYMSADEKQRLRQLFHQAKIVQHYGLTEASRTTLLRVDLASDAALESVGSPGKSTELALAEDGRLKIRGPHVAAGLLNEGRVKPITDDDGWFVTSDLAEISGPSLYYKGRADDVINISGVKFDPANIEAEINHQLPGTDHVVLCRIADELRGDGILAAWLDSSARTEADVVQATVDALARRNIHAKPAIKTQRIGYIPKTATGKIKRKEISANYVPPASAQAATPRKGNPQSVEELYRSLFAINSIDASDTFASLGGGSLNYISASVALERILGDLPPNWDKLTVKELKAREGQAAAKPRLTAVMETSVMLRAYAVTAVVANHAGLNFLAGGAALLMLAAGLNFGRFQWSSCLSLNFGSFARSVLINILIPFWGLLIAYPLLKNRPIDIHYVFLIGNNFPSATILPFPAWFVAALIQGLAIFILPLAIAPVRRWARSHTLHYGLAVLLVAVVIRVIDGWTNWGASAGLKGMQLSWVFWLFALGFCVHCAQNLRARLLLSALLVCFPLAFYAGDWSRIFTVAIGSLLLMWAPSLRVPRFIKPVVGTIGSASLFIYLLHSRAPVEFLPSVWGIDWFRIAVGVAIGVLAWFVYSKAVGICTSRWSLMNDPKYSSGV